MHKGFYIIKDTLDILFFTKQGRTVQTKGGIWFYINLSRWYSHSGYCKYFCLCSGNHCGAVLV